MTGTPAATEAADHAFMGRALVLAARGLYSTDPNPRVGCVIVRGGRVVGEGWHRAAGGPHAEVEALRAAGEAARGATVYVTLEPCAHHGRTPPCTDALIRAGVARVVVAMADPNREVPGGGLHRLAAAGMEVRSGVQEAQALALNCGFASRMRRGRPWVRLKLAATLDGRTATAGGESRWITGEAARADVQHWRARSSAILTGAGTVRADDPRLDVREAELPADLRAAHCEPVRQPLRAIAASRPDLPAGLAMHGRGGAILVLSPSAPTDPERGRLAAAGAEPVEVPPGPGGIDLAAGLEALAARGCNEVLAECGATLAGALLERGLADEMLLYVAPSVLGSDARPLVALPGARRMSERLEFRLLDVRRLGDDVRLILSPRDGDGARS